MRYNTFTIKNARAEKKHPCASKYEKSDLFKNFYELFKTRHIMTYKRAYTLQKRHIVRDGCPCVEKNDDMAKRFLC